MILPSKDDLKAMVEVLEKLKDNEKIFGEYVKSIKHQIQRVPNFQTFFFKLLADKEIIDKFIKYYFKEG